ncbi:MAG: rRNA maturation RNase YbeY [Balneolaceae bacterium]
MDVPVLQIFNPSGLTLPFSEQLFRQVTATVENVENVHFSLLEVVFVDEAEIVRLNRTFLGRNYVTDVISFRYDENRDLQSVEGTLYCCADRIYEQAGEFHTEPEYEFYRIFIHGLLHLAGYNDQTEAEKEIMTNREDHYLKSIKEK